MQDILLKLIPNVMKDLSILGKSIIETLEMTVRAGLISFVLGMIIGTALVVTKKGGILQNKVIYQVLDKTVNVLRSVPFIILLFCLLPLTRLISGTAIGVKGAIVPLVFGTTPFFSLVQNSTFGKAGSSALSNQVAAVKLMLKYGADPDKEQGLFRKSPLGYAVMRNGDMELVKALVEGGAAITDKIVESAKNSEIKQYLIQHQKGTNK